MSGVREVASFGRLLAIFFLVPAVVACLCNFARWNYVFTPPALSPLVDEFDSVSTIGYFDLEADGTDYYAVNGDTDYGAYGYLTDTDFGRVPRWADSQGLGTISVLDAAALESIPQMITRAGWPVDFLTNPQGVPYVGPIGYVVQGEDANGDPLMLLSMVDTIDDDHYSYREGVFRSGLLIDANDYRYDNAGIEFAQWPFWFLGTFVLWGFVILLAGLLPANRNPLRI